MTRTTFLPMRAKLLACNHQLPHTPVSTDQLLDALAHLSGKKYARLAKLLSLRLGVKQRHLTRSIETNVSSPSPKNSELASNVLRQCLKDAKMDVNDLDYLIGHTTTPDTQLPPSIAWVAEQLNYDGLFAELRQACTGFVSGLQFALPRIESLKQPVAIIGSETGSVYFDYDPEFLNQAQLVNYLQMGDGAGGVILGPDDGSKRGIISSVYMGQMGVGKSPGLYLDGGSESVYTQADKAKFMHDAQGVKRNGEALFEASINALAQQGHELDSFDYIIPHQASGNIDKQFAKKTGIAREKIINDAQNVGNLGSAAIWCSFSRLVHSGKLAEGDRVVVLGAEATKYMYGGFIYQH
ncbi:3-oxoacyl-ACP synthase III family protein [Vibrio tapetis subsp. quintayensis]|uniref:3-oxoacyl-ACP synthase III family protein n=1 Tax=Vibrio tapetis TaxID=52443 RepID=UPI0025B329D5|nr:3-oxoacyl-ACP synthase III family protein [Vibrio tapetis]MDN3683057.1 3-oxoacyl-ACP synthase III family protein [Vibrio tapetis subsp. quintayensis]